MADETASKPPDWADVIRQAYEEIDARLRQQFDRSLPMQDALFDRWQSMAGGLGPLSLQIVNPNGQVMMERSGS